MRALPTRMTRRRKNASARDGSFFKKESNTEPSFFADHAQNATFFQPATILSRKCGHCEREEKQVNRAPDKKEEGKKVHRTLDKKEEAKKVHRAADKKEEDKKISKAPDKTEEDKKVYRAIEKEENEEQHNRSLPVKHAEEDKELRLSEGSDTATGTAKTSAYIGGLNSGGSKLPAETTRFFYNRMGYNFKDVNIHTGAAATESAKEVNAKAYTIDNHIVFNEGQYNPASAEGKKLLAHELTHVIQKGSASELQRAPDERANLQKSYSISIEKGDKDWSPAEVGIIKNALAKLAADEKLAIKDYKFIRWSGKAARIKLDPNYHDPGVSECGLHEADIAKGVYKISMYDECFGDPEAKSDTAFGIDTGEFNLLHEIGHAMEVSEYKNAYLKYSAANKAYNDAIAKYKDTPVTPAITAEVANLTTAEQIADKAMEDAKGRALKDFSALKKGKEDITTYGATSPQEAFAEMFAAYKANPDFVKKSYADVYQWLVAKGYFKKVPAATKKKK